LLVKIWIISQYFHPENFGINQIAADLAGRGHGVTVLTAMPNYPSGEFAPGYGGWRVRRENHHGVSVIRVPVLARGKGTPIRLALNYLSYAIVATLAAPFLLRGQVDSIFVYQPSPLTVAFPAVLMGWLKGCSLVLWVQDLWPDSLTMGDVRPWPVALTLVGKIARFVYRRCALILVQSPAYIAPIQALAPNVPVQYFPNSADSQYRPIDPPSAVERPAGLPEGFRVLFAGNIGVAQDFETILSAAERLRHSVEIQWVIVGEGRRKNWLRNQIITRKLGGTFHLVDQQQADVMPAYFAFAGALLVTLSRSKAAAMTIPAKLQAYLACGRPVIAAIDGEAARIVAESGGGLTCQSGAPAALADAVLALSKMPPGERDNMGKAGRRYFEQHFEPALLMDRLEVWLAGLNKRRQGPP
jgi:colanic acid biosynthesis glycosyl transferase WcaI